MADVDPTLAPPALLPWQEAQWRQLMAAAERGRVHHALLLRGPAGTGKSGFARRVAAHRLCERPTPQGEACGECRGCTLRAAGTHPDLHALRPPEDKRSISVEQVRELIDALSLTAHARGSKVVLVEPAEALTREAANTLLKTLEEPPGDCLFVLVADRAGLLLATIRSRCQTLSFPVPRPDAALAWLARSTSGRTTGADRQAECLEACGGAPLAALAMLEEGGLGARDAVLTGMVAVVQGRLDPVEAAESWRPLGVAEALRWIERAVHDLMLAALAPGHRRAGAAPLQPLEERLDLQGLLALQAACEDLRRATAAGVPVNEQLALERLALGCRAAGRR